MAFGIETTPMMGDIVKYSLLALVVYVATSLIQRTVQYFKMKKYFDNIQGESNFRFLTGNIHMFPKGGEDRFRYTMNLMNKYSQYYNRFWLGPFRPQIRLTHPETAKKLFKSSFPKPYGVGQGFQMLKPWIGQGLLSANGDRWYRSRHLITPAFHFDILKTYNHVFNDCTDIFFAKLDPITESSKSINISPIMTLLTLDVVLKCAMSYDIDVQKNDFHPYAKGVQEALSLFEKRTKTPYLWPDFIYKLTTEGRKFYANCKFVNDIAETVIDKRQEELKKNGPPKNRRKDFLDTIILAKDTDGNSLSKEELKWETATFMFAGHDTTACAAPWIINDLACHQDWLQKCQEEVDQILKDRESSEILYSDLPNLKTLNLCIKESLRMHPPVQFIGRETNEEMNLDGTIIPVGTTVVVPVQDLHHNPIVWEEPHKFNPERFTDENIKKVDSFAFVPFSAGSRNCMGKHFALNELKVVLARFIHRYNVCPAPNRPPPDRKAEPVLRSEHGLFFTITKRS